MPRSNRRRREVQSRPPAPGAEVRTETWHGRPWHVRRLTGATSTREYRCPGCHQEITPGTPHVVAWPADGVHGVSERRHWHTRCWRSRHAVNP